MSAGVSNLVLVDYRLYSSKIMELVESVRPMVGRSTADREVTILQWSNVIFLVTRNEYPILHTTLM